MSEPDGPKQGPRLVSHFVEYRVREVKRYILTRYESRSYDDGKGDAGTQSYGEFDNFSAADRTGRLVAMGERSTAWDESEIRFTDKFDTSIRLNRDGTSQQVDADGKVVEL